MYIIGVFQKKSGITFHIPDLAGPPQKSNPLRLSVARAFTIFLRKNGVAGFRILRLKTFFYMCADFFIDNYRQTEIITGMKPIESNPIIKMIRESLSVRTAALYGASLTPGSPFVIGDYYGHTTKQPLK